MSRPTLTVTIGPDTPLVVRVNRVPSLEEAQHVIEELMQQTSTAERLKLTIELATQLDHSALTDFRAIWARMDWFGRRISQVAVVVSDAYHYGLVRQMSAYAASVQIAVDPFYSLEAAAKWLGR